MMPLDCFGVPIPLDTIKAENGFRRPSGEEGSLWYHPDLDGRGHQVIEETLALIRESWQQQSPEENLNPVVRNNLAEVQEPAAPTSSIPGVQFVMKEPEQTSR